MLTVRLPHEIEDNLNALAHQLAVNKSKLVVEALSQYIEDKLDYLLASKIYKKKNKSYTHEKVLHELGL